MQFARTRRSALAADSVTSTGEDTCAARGGAIGVVLVIELEVEQTRQRDLKPWKQIAAIERICFVKDHRRRFAREDSEPARPGLDEPDLVVGPRGQPSALTAQVRRKPRQPTKNHDATDDTEQAEQPGEADAERRPLHPPVSRRCHQVDEEEERQDERPLHEEAERVQCACHCFSSM